MKELNRREFLTLSGAAVVALSLAGCGGPSTPPTPPAPPASESKEMALFKAINEVWYEVNSEVITHPDLTASAFWKRTARRSRCTRQRRQHLMNPI